MMQVLMRVAAIISGVLLAACGGGSETHQVSGTVSGTGGGVVQLSLVRGDSVQYTTVAGDGSFTFPKAIGGEYFVFVDSDPVGVACTTRDSEGAVTPLYAKTVTCASTSFTIGGAITSDPDVGDVLVELRNTVNGDSITLANSGDFAFNQPVAADENYNVVVASLTPGHACSVSNGSGAAANDVVDIEVSCVPAPVASARAQLMAVSGGTTATGSPPTRLKAEFSNQFIFVTWDADSVSTYRLYEDRDGVGPGANVYINTGYERLNGKPPVGNREWVIGVDPAHVMGSHSRTRFSVQACLNNVCSPVSEPVRIDFAKLPNLVLELDKALATAVEQFRDVQGELLVTNQRRIEYRAWAGHPDPYWQWKIKSAGFDVERLTRQAKELQRRAIGVWERRNEFPGACNLRSCYAYLLNDVI